MNSLLSFYGIRTLLYCTKSLFEEIINISVEFEAFYTVLTSYPCPSSSFLIPLASGFCLMDEELVKDWVEEEDEDKYVEFLRFSMRAFFISSTCFTNPVEKVEAYRKVELDSFIIIIASSTYQFHLFIFHNRDDISKAEIALFSL